jgi:hypothetical protein
VNLHELVETASNKQNFLKISAYVDFGLRYLEFIKTDLQAVIVSRNEHHYRFFQYKEDGTFNVTRPINSKLMLGLEEFEEGRKNFALLLKNIRDEALDTKQNRSLLNNFIYTTQQCIGAVLDALPANKSNTARKINGDLFERLIRLVIAEVGIEVKEGVIDVPIRIDGEVAFHMKYQHDLIIEVDSSPKAIGSVKTSSKDRLDKIFIDKFLYNRLTGLDTPHFGIFLNDVQRKGRKASTVLASHSFLDISKAIPSD